MHCIKKPLCGKTIWIEAKYFLLTKNMYIHNVKEWEYLVNLAQVYVA